MAKEPQKPMSLPTPPGAASGKKEEKGGSAAMPLWTSNTGDKLGGMPLFRGAGQKSASVFGRLKSLKTKDAAFIGAGLAVLVMAPVAEFLISEGEGDGGALTQGFSQNGPAFPGSGDPAEVGILGLARGGIPGDTSDVITPLNARDPSSLIMGGGGDKEAPAPAAAAEPKRDAPKDNVWDKVVSSAKSGVKEASRKVSLPKPNAKLAGAINGLRSLSGGSTGASLKLAAPESKGLFSAPKGSNSLAQVQSAPGYRGTGQRIPGAGSGGNGFDGRRGGGFGGAGGGAAGDVMSGGISGGGKGTGFSGGDGEQTKNPGGNSTKDNKQLGESLAFLRQKMNMEKAIDLKWAKKRYDELERKKMIEQTLVQTAQQAFMKVLDKLLEGKKDGGGGGGGGSPGGGGGGDPSKPPAPGATPGSPGSLPTAGRPGNVAWSPRDMSDIAVPAQRGFAETNGVLGRRLEGLAAKKGELSAYVGAINPNDQYGKQIHPPASAALKKVDASNTALADASGKLAESEKTLGEANGKLGQVNGKLGENINAYEGFKGDLEGVVKGFGDKGAPPQAAVDASKLDGSAGKVQAAESQKGEFKTLAESVNKAQEAVGGASEAAKKAPRDLQSEIAAVQKVIEANPNCEGCKKALAVLQESQQLMQDAGKVADYGVRAGGNAVDRTNAAGSASESLDGLLERGKPQVSAAKDATATDYKKMKELEKAYGEAKSAYDQATEPAAKTALKEKMDGYVKEADAIRDGATPRAEKIGRWVDSRRKQLDEAKRKLGA